EAGKLNFQLHLGRGTWLEPKALSGCSYRSEELPSQNGTSSHATRDVPVRGALSIQPVSTCLSTQ
ncbi:hypothetical protein NDU88_001089, partial [Pleurodeles waltl]